MRKVRKKLHSRSGASMLMALLLLLAALMVSAVIISAALSSALSIRTDRAQQQAFLSVSSAAELMAGKLESGTCKYERVVTNLYRTQNKADTPVSSTAYHNADGPFSKIIYEAIALVQDYPGATFRGTYTIRAKGHADVTAEVLMKREEDAGRSPRFQLTVWFVGGEEPNRCRICLTMEGIETTDTVDSAFTGGSIYRRQEVVTTSISWKNPRLQRKEAGENG